jgi:hypothetical protein
MIDRKELEQLSKEDLIDRLITEKNSNQYLLGKIRLYELPSPARAYYVGQKILNQQVDYLDKFDLEREIGVNPKEDKIYDRAMDLFEKLSANAVKIDSLKRELNLSGDKDKDTKIGKPSFTPESVADSVGELAGQHKR